MGSTISPKRNAPPFMPKRWGAPACRVYFRLLSIGYFEHRLGARHRVAGGGLVRVARLSRRRSGTRTAGPLDHFAHASADRPRNAPGRLHLGAVVPEYGRVGEGEDDRHRRHDVRSNAALRSIVRRDAGESYEEFLTTLAKASGIGTPTRPIWRGSIANARRRGRMTTGRIRAIPTPRLRR